MAAGILRSSSLLHHSGRRESSVYCRNHGDRCHGYRGGTCVRHLKGRRISVLGAGYRRRSQWARPRLGRAKEQNLLRHHPATLLAGVVIGTEQRKEHGGGWLAHLPGL